MSFEEFKIPETFVIKDGAPAPVLIVIDASLYQDGTIEIERGAYDHLVFEQVSSTGFQLKPNKTKEELPLSFSSTTINEPFVSLDEFAVRGCVCNGHFEFFIQDEEGKEELLLQLMKDKCKKERNT